MKVYIEVNAFEQPRVIGAKKHTYVGRIAKNAYWSREKQARVESPFVTAYNEDGTVFGSVMVNFDLVFQPKAASVQANAGAIETVAI